jgi:2-polyprenyl-3-methyl-5-hydroxy-6-metoxy-1,4-benzoquinol methylase
MDQQEETQRYFSQHARDWQARAAGAKYDVIKGRNDAVLLALDSVSPFRRFLDVGCGSGQLVIEVAKRGIECVGIDFVPEMIAECRSNLQAAGIEAEFVCGSFFDWKAPDGSLDGISAQGFVEYLSLEQLRQFFAECHSMLRPGGSLVVGSRNRLFNIISLNDFTEMEAKLGELPMLIEEAVALHRSRSQEEAIEAISRFSAVDRRYPDSYPTTGVSVSRRHQFSPSDLSGRAIGFAPRAIYPVHFHGLPLSIKGDVPDLHTDLASMARDVFAHRSCIVPYCSTFVLELRKA